MRQPDKCSEVEDQDDVMTDVVRRFWTRAKPLSTALPVPASPSRAAPPRRSSISRRGSGRNAQAQDRR